MNSRYAVDLFAGIGGMALGFEQAGFDVLLAVEMNPALAKIHADNFPHTRVVVANVREINGNRIIDECRQALTARGENSTEWDGAIAVLFGGPPCQGASMSGRRILTDPRNELMGEMARIASEISPKYVVVENVVGMTIGAQRKIPLHLAHQLRTMGYRTNIDDGTLRRSILNAADFGTPQDRKRMFIIATRGIENPKLPRPNGTRSAKRTSIPGLQFQSDGPTVWDALEGLPNPTPDGDCLVLQKSALTNEYASVLGGHSLDPADRSRFAGKVPEMVDGFAKTHHDPQVTERFANTQPGKVEAISRFYRLDAQGLAPTQRAGTDSLRGNHTAPRPIHPTEPRVISVREAARLHGYPDAFTFGGTIWMGLRGIGNSVPPPLARAVAESLTP